VLDAVGGGVAEIGHTASFYWQGKMPAAAFFTTVPFGLTPSEHVAWIEAGGVPAIVSVTSRSGHSHATARA
jgi:TRAP-type mannitol/chloroaromatic compound transport system substrate-binding protein